MAFPNRTKKQQVRFVTNLTENRKEEGVRISKQTLNLLKDGGHRIISMFVTGDETYIPFCDVPTRQGSKIWVFEDYPTLTMVKRQQAIEKVMYAVFFRSTGLVKDIKLEGKKTVTANWEFDIAHSVVSRLWKSFKTTGMCSRRHGGGRVRSTTPAEDKYIVLSAKRNRRTTAQQHRTAHLQWCREHHNWTEQDWACVLFSDECRFSLSSDCRRQLIWRESGTAYRPENIQEKDRYPTCSIMVWAGIMINGRTRLHVVANGTMTGQRYIDEVLLPHVRLFRGAVGDKFVFMDDNATCHRTLAVQDCLDSEGIQRLVWPARSPDLNPIENVWDALGRQVAGRNYPPTNKNTLIRALTEEWDKLPQQLLDNVVQSMVRRVECCITLLGGHIPY
ncbi:transposable element Tcb2 transposase [Trichonephila clavipes]|nr:transposable element Tcb2 transposase [Trichonephila clavipes]